jgi:hypothetical protein
MEKLKKALEIFSKYGKYNPEIKTDYEGLIIKNLPVSAVSKDDTATLDELGFVANYDWDSSGEFINYGYGG